MDEWKWKLSNEEFIDFFQWTVLFSELCKTAPADCVHILTNRELSDQKATELGITYSALVHEMVRIGMELQQTISGNELKKAESE